MMNVSVGGGKSSRLVRIPNLAGKAGPKCQFCPDFHMVRFEDNLTLHVFFLILRCLSGEVRSRRGRPRVGSGRSWKEFFGPGTLHDGMGQKSGRNGTPLPQSRVSL